MDSLTIELRYIVDGKVVHADAVDVGAGGVSSYGLSSALSTLMGMHELPDLADLPEDLSGFPDA